MILFISPFSPGSLISLLSGLSLSIFFHVHFVCASRMNYIKLISRLLSSLKSFTNYSQPSMQPKCLGMAYGTQHVCFFQPLPMMLQTYTHLPLLQILSLQASIHVIPTACNILLFNPPVIFQNPINKFLLWNPFSKSIPCLGLLHDSCSQFPQHPVHTFIIISQHLSD